MIIIFGIYTGIRYYIVYKDIKKSEPYESNAEQIKRVINLIGFYNQIIFLLYLTIYKLRKETLLYFRVMRISRKFYLGTIQKKYGMEKKIECSLSINGLTEIVYDKGQWKLYEDIAMGRRFTEEINVIEKSRYEFTTKFLKKND
jgi:hypothetical protein